MFLHSFLKITFTIFLQHFYKKSFVIKIDTDFNLNILLKLFFFSLIVANNNLPLKIYYENIMIAFPSFFPFFPLFFSPPHTYHISFFFPFFFPSFYHLHTCTLTLFFSFFSFFPLFFPTTSSKLQNIPQSSLSSFLTFLLALRL